MKDVKLLARDAMGRILKVKTKSGVLLTPTFFPVINPNKLIITPKEIREKFKWNEIITNAYIIWRSKFKDEVMKKGLHKFYDFDGIIFTDSGAYQIWQYGDVEITNEQTVKFQEAMGADIGTFLDIPMPHTIPVGEARRGVKLTIERAEECKALTQESKTLWLATVQGSVYRSLVKKCAKAIAMLDFDYYGCGTLKIATDEWRFREQIDYVMTAKKYLPISKPLHFWGLGHPATFALFVSLGFDSFDSASYVLYAEDERYMTVEGTLRLDEIEEFPCSCKVCSSYTPKEIKSMRREERTKLLATHNLWVILTEIKRIREAIRNGWLLELVQQRVRAHTKLYEALIYAWKKYGNFIEEFDPVTKKSAFFYSGPESYYRPEVIRAKRWLKRVKSRRYFKKEPFGKIPVGLKYVYPIGQSIVPGKDEIKEEPTDEEQVLQTIDFLFGSGASRLFKKISVKRSKTTGMIRKVFLEGKLVGAIRSNDGFFIPNINGAKLIKKVCSYPKNRVVVGKDAVKFVSKGKSVFTKFVVDIDKELRPYQEVLVVDEDDNLLAAGKLILNPREIEEFKRHVVVKIRHYRDQWK